MMVLFSVVTLVLHALIARYQWARLVRDTRLGGRTKQLATAVIIIGAVSMPLTMWGARFLSPEIGRTAGWPVFLWMTLGGLVLFLLLSVDLIRLGARLVGWLVGVSRRPRAAGGASPRLPRAVEDLDPGRRTFLARAVGGVALTAAAGTTAYGVREALGELRIVDVPIALPRWPSALNGYRIVQLTDVHIGYTVTRGYVAEMVARANAAGGNLIAITGDLVDGDVDTLADAAAPLGDLRAPDGVYFVTGNHEYYAGANAWISYLRSLGIRVLRNERVELGSGDARFDLVGIDDHSAGKFLPDHGPDLRAALAGRDPSRETILLAHQPRQVHAAAKHGIGLQLSGHTHGGQVWPWHYLASLQQGGLLAGRYRRGGTELYVSRGAGYWGPPVRVAAPAEISRIVLSRA